MDITPSTICVVTGGSRGIGRAIATAVGRRGARVVICGRREADVARAVLEMSGLGIRAAGWPCDVADRDSVTRFARRTLDEVGTPDILVNNAGLGHFAPLSDLSDAQIDDTFAVNVRGIFSVTRAFLPGMLERGRGDVVNIASLAGHNGFAGGTAYAASKHAVVGFSKSLMLEVRTRGIRVIAVCPGSVDTDFFDAAGTPRDDLDRVLAPQDVAAAVLAALELPERALLSQLDIRPANP